MSNYIDALTTEPAHMLTGTTLAEDPTPAWTAATYAVGDERHVVATHRVYRCALAGASAISPELDATRWQDNRPTNRWAPFDEYTDTAATSTTQDIVYVLASRYVNAVALYGLAGRGVVVRVQEGAGGPEIYRYPAAGESRIKAGARGYWQYAYGGRRTRKNFVLTGIPIRPNGVMTITITGATGQRRSLGMLVRGNLRTLIGAGWGGVMEDAEVTPKTYTYRETLPDGRQRIVPRGSSKDIAFSLVMERKSADAAVLSLTDLLSRPTAWIVSAKPGFSGLTGFGILRSAPVRYRFSHAYIDCNIEGYV